MITQERGKGGMLIEIEGLTLQQSHRIESSILDHFHKQNLSSPSKKYQILDLP